MKQYLDSLAPETAVPCLSRLATIVVDTTPRCRETVPFNIKRQAFERTSPTFNVDGAPFDIPTLNTYQRGAPPLAAPTLNARPSAAATAIDEWDRDRAVQT